MNSIWNRPGLGGNVAQSFLTDLGGSSHPRISIMGGRFTLIDAGGQQFGAPFIVKQTPQGQKMVMLAIIIGSNPKKSRVFYREKFDPSNPAPPDCFSDNGIAPSSNANDPQARTCAECEWHKWGSDISEVTGKKVKACDEKKKLAALIIGDTAALTYELQIPPKTLKNMASYSAQVTKFGLPGAGRNADLSDLVTEISFVTGQNMVLEFMPHCLIDNCYIDANGAIQVNRNNQQQPVQAEDGGASVAALQDEIWDSDELVEILNTNDQPWTAPAGFIGGGSPQAAIEYQHGVNAGNAANEAAREERGPANAPIGNSATPAPERPLGPYSPPPGLGAGAQPQTMFEMMGGAPPPPPQTQQQPATATAPKQRRSRKGTAGAGAGTPPALAAPAPAAPQAGVQEEIPPFLQRSRNGGDNTNASGGAATTFGAGQPASPTNTMEDALAKAFGRNKR